MTWVQTIQSSPYTASLTSLWPLVLGLHSPLTRHATVPPTLSVEGVPALSREEVSRCVTGECLVGLPRRVREAFVAQRRTTMTPPSPCVSRRLGDPQVAQRTRFVLRFPLVVSSSLEAGFDGSSTGGLVILRGIKQQASALLGPADGGSITTTWVQTIQSSPYTT